MFHINRGLASIGFVFFTSMCILYPLYEPMAQSFRTPLTSSNNPALHGQPGRSLNSIGDRVWEDNNMNGIQESGETGINDVTVNLYEDNNADGLPDQNQPISTTITSHSGGQDGYYELSQIPDGLYVVEFIPPSVYHSTPSNQGIDLNDSDADSSGLSHTIDLGSTHCTKVEDEDLQSNGIIGETEYIIEYKDEGEPYSVSFFGGDILDVTIKGGPDTAYYPNPPFQDLKAPINPVSGKHYAISYFNICYTLQDLEAVDAGFYRKASLEGTVWHDYNEDGSIQSSDNKEFGFQQWSVKLMQNGQVISSQSTDDKGEYAFQQLDPGSYTVQITPEAGHNPTYDPNGINTPNQATEVLTSNMDRNQFNFGYVGTGTVGNRIWEDENANKQYDDGEHVFEDIQVTVDLADRPFRDTLYTSSDGTYLFPKLSPGTYKITVDPPQGYQPHYDEDGISTPNQSSLTLQPGATHLTADFGYIEQGSPLPVRWISFSAHMTKQEVVRLQWIVEEEADCDYYEIQRSVDGEHWTRIGKREVIEPSRQKKRYRFTDARPNCQFNYYRIRQTDQNGRSSISEIRQVKHHCAEDMRISPNPAHSHISISIPSEYIEKRVRIYSMDGRLHLKHDIPSNPQSQRITLDISDLHAGQYYLFVLNQDNEYIGNKLLMIRP